MYSIDVLFDALKIEDVKEASQRIAAKIKSELENSITRLGLDKHECGSTLAFVAYNANIDRGILLTIGDSPIVIERQDGRISVIRDKFEKDFPNETVSCFTSLFYNYVNVKCFTRNKVKSVSVMSDGFEGFDISTSVCAEIEDVGDIMTACNFLQKNQQHDDITFCKIIL